MIRTHSPGVLPRRRRPGLLVTVALALLCAALPLVAGCRDSQDDQPTGSDGSQRAVWGDWRGPNRDGISRDMPQSLPASPTFLWRVRLSAQSLGALAATDKCVIVSDKDAEKLNDVWRCLDADTGKELWTLTYRAEGEMDYTSAPRAAAVIDRGLVYLLSAFGDLYCVKLGDGEVVWQCNFRETFSPKVPTWGYCGSPLIVDGRLIVSTTSPAAALVAMDRFTGKVLWQSPGGEPGYGALILGRFGGRRQIVGHERRALGGWDPATGKRLWTLKPPEPNDYNVPTPVDLGEGRLLVATENNGTRIYEFNDDGTIRPEPVALNEDLLPDSSTPVVLDGRVWGIGTEGACCLDLDNGLKTVWQDQDEPFTDYVTFMGGNGRVLIVAKDGRIALMPSRPKPTDRPKWLRVFEPTKYFDPEVWSHPAIAPNRLYLRSQSEIVCLLLDAK